MTIEFDVDFDGETEDWKDTEKSFAEDWSIVNEDNEVVTIENVSGHIENWSTRLYIELSDGTRIRFDYKCDGPYDRSSSAWMDISNFGSFECHDDFCDATGMGRSTIDTIMEIYRNQIIE